MNIPQSIILFSFLPILMYASHSERPLDYHTKGMQLICAIAVSGNLEEVNKALENGADINYQKPDSGDTPFHFLLRYQADNKPVMHRIILDPKFKVNIKNKHGLTAIEEITQFIHEEQHK